MTRRVVLALIGSVLVALALAAGPAGAADIDPDDVAGEPGRVLVISVPGLTWADVRDHDLPALEGLFAEAALADMAPRAIGPRATPG
ncbi:MAG TPA: hypothetical protein VF228_11755, partial [Iamia sp.]